MSTAVILNERPGADLLPRQSGASSLLNGHYAPPPADKDGKQWVRTSALVQADAQDLYKRWRDLERVPEWQEQMTSVKETGEKTSHWTMTVDGKDVEWDSEILADEPGKRIAWHTVAGDVDQAGEVIFESAPGGRGTMITVLIEFRLSKLSSTLATLANRNPKQAVIENLRHFKALAEAGEIPRTEPQPHGGRGMVGKGKRSLYGENVPLPPNQGNQ